MSELKPCPFCGSEHLIFDEGYIGGMINCKRCDAAGPWVQVTENIEEEAIRRWNTRCAPDE